MTRNENKSEVTEVKQAFIVWDRFMFISINLQFTYITKQQENRKHA